MAAAGLLAAALVAEAQPAGKVYRIGWLDQGSAEGGGPGIAAFRNGLKGLGYTEGPSSWDLDEARTGNQRKPPAGGGIGTCDWMRSIRSFRPLGNASERARDWKSSAHPSVSGEDALRVVERLQLGGPPP